MSDENRQDECYGTFLQQHHRPTMPYRDELIINESYLGTMHVQTDQHVETTHERKARAGEMNNLAGIAKSVDNVVSRRTRKVMFSVHYIT